MIIWDMTSFRKWMFQLNSEMSQLLYEGFRGRVAEISKNKNSFVTASCRTARASAHARPTSLSDDTISVASGVASFSYMPAAAQV